jgi:hypothetical protein
MEELPREREYRPVKVGASSRAQFPENSPGRVARYCLNLDALDLVERDLVARAVVELGDARAFVLGADQCADPVAVR